MEGVRGKLAKGTVWISAAGLVTNSFAFLSTIILARFLTPADFGLVAFATVIQAVLSSVTDLSLNSALVQHRNPTAAHFNTAWTLGFVRSVAIAVIFCIAAFPVSKLDHDARIMPVMFVLALGIILSGVANPRTIMLTRDLIFWQQFMLTVGQRLATFVVTVVIAFIYRSYWALVLGTIAGQLVNVITSYTVLPYLPRPGVKHTKELIHFSIWLTASQIINTLNYNFDQLAIGIFLSRASLGYYTVGNNLAVLPTREATNPITKTLFPAFSALKDDQNRLGAAYQKAQALVTAIALPLGVGMALVADPLVRLCMGEKWHPVVIVIQVLASVFALQTLGTLSLPLAMAAGATRLLFMRDLQALVIRIPFIVIGMWADGLIGIIIARALTGFIAVFLHMYVVKRITALTFRAQFAANTRSLASICVMALMVLPISYQVARLGVSTTDLTIEIAILVTIGAVSYLGSHILLWIAAGKPNGPELEMTKAVDKILGRLRLRAAHRA